RPRGARRAGAHRGRAARLGAMTLQTALDVLEQERAPAYRSRQLAHAVYSELAERWDEVSALPRPLRERLERDAPLRTLSEEASQRADDGTIKLQLRTHDGYPLEAVAMSHGPRRTVCLSSQSGCALACTFCATGRMGLGRNLTPEEISEQLLRLARLLRDEQDARISNVVMMGMGEPFHNYDNVLAAVRTINAPDAFGLGARQIAISTAGWIPGIERLAEEPMQVKLALSLHAPNDELRATLMPVTRRFPLARLMAACRLYRERTRRRIFVEYLLLDGVNDTLELAEQLAGLLGPEGFHVNLIAYNPTQAGYRASPQARVAGFAGVLARHGVSASYRRSHGGDIDAACGQLAAGGVRELRRRRRAVPA
ncbi:MAG: 23S rRNA (adenine(2503)-C(2))-methyltransferase RlmN, partial [Gaiellales bacterium]